MAAVSALALTFTAVSAPRADASADTWSQARLEAVTEWALQGTNLDAPPEAPGTVDAPPRVPAEALERMYELEQTAPPDVRREAWRLRAKAKLIRGMEFLAPRALPLLAKATAAGDAFLLGWDIGSALRASWHQELRIRPYPEYYAHNPVFKEKGEPIASDSGTLGRPAVTMYAPDDLLSWGGHWTNLGLDVGLLNNWTCDGMPIDSNVGVGNEVLVGPTFTCQVNTGIYPQSNWYAADGQIEVAVQRLQLTAPLKGPLPADVPNIGTESPSLPPPTDMGEARERIGGVLSDHPGDYPGLIPWLSGQIPDIGFPNVLEKWEKHGHEFEDPYDDIMEYWRDAADIVERGRNNDPAIDKCVRTYDGAEIFWDDSKQALVIVKNGRIDNYFPPDTGKQYWRDECAK